MKIPLHLLLLLLFVFFLSMLPYWKVTMCCFLFVKSSYVLLSLCQNSNVMLSLCQRFQCAAFSLSKVPMWCFLFVKSSNVMLSLCQKFKCAAFSLSKFQSLFESPRCCFLLNKSFNVLLFLVKVTQKQLYYVKSGGLIGGVLWKRRDLLQTAQPKAARQLFPSYWMYVNTPELL